MKKIDNSDVTVIIPALNEEKNVGEVIQELNHNGYHKILVMDGCSTDKTVELAKEFGADVLIQNGKGKGAALREAFSYGGFDGDIVVMMDADGSMNPKEVPSLVKALESGADLAKASRFLPYGHSEDMSLIRRIGNQFFIFLVNRFWSTRYTDLCYGFGAFTKQALNKVGPHLKSTNFEIETEVFIKAKKFDLKVVEVPSIELRRRHGRSNLSVLRDGLRIIKTIVKEIPNRPSIKKRNH